jgi:hypothetical protein
LQDPDLASDGGRVEVKLVGQGTRTLGADLVQPREHRVPSTVDGERGPSAQLDLLGTPNHQREFPFDVINRVAASGPCSLASILTRDRVAAH